MEFNPTEAIARIINKFLLKNPGWVSEVKGNSIILNDKYEITVKYIGDEHNLTTRQSRAADVCAYCGGIEGEAGRCPLCGGP